MLDYLARKFIKEYTQVQKKEVRTAYGYLGGVVAVLTNLLLFLMKLIAGYISGSLAITADAFNNLSDSGSGLATILGFYYAAKPADKKHPFGHGRLEYISALFIAFLILLVGARFMMTSVERILSPEFVEFNRLSVIILLISIVLKAYLALFNRKLGKKIRSEAIVATAFDSISDVVITSVVLISLLLGKRLGLQIDGYVGGAVALLIIVGALKLVWETLSPILGEATDEDLVLQLEKEILSLHPSILGVHDMVVHDYGPSRRFVTVDMELPHTLSLVEAHYIADKAERSISERFDLSLFVHVDPKNTKDKETYEMLKKVEEVLKDVDPSLELHDFQMLDFGERTVLFDLVLPYEYNEQRTQEIIDRVERGIREKAQDCDLLIKIDKEGVHLF